MFWQILMLGFLGGIKAELSNVNVVTNSTNSTIKSTIINFSSVVPINITKDGRTYFFKYNTNNNQFRVYNRVNMNGAIMKNITEPSNKKSVQLLTKSNMNELRKFEAFLDDEWNYSSSIKLNTTELPMQIHPFLYNSIVQKASQKSENGDQIADITKIIFNKKTNGSMILSFHLGQIEPNHQIHNAELHFYWSVPEKSDFYKNSCVLRLYEVDHKSNNTVAGYNPDTHKLLNVIYVSKAQTGWQMFRISRKSIESWVNMTEELRLLISISQANQVNTSTVFNDTQNESKWRTFLIIKIHNTDDNDTKDITVTTLNGPTFSYNGASKYCAKKDFYIDFQKLHWSNFIIAPEGFMANDCHGKCTRQNTDTFSNHLKMLTTFQDVDKKIRAPCCVPTKFYSLPIMYYDKSGNVVIKIYKDLIAAECGCR